MSPFASAPLDCASSLGCLLRTLMVLQDREREVLRAGQKARSDAAIGELEGASADLLRADVAEAEQREEDAGADCAALEVAVDEHLASLAISQPTQVRRALLTADRHARHDQTEIPQAELNELRRLHAASFPLPADAATHR